MRVADPKRELGRPKTGDPISAVFESELILDNDFGTDPYVGMKASKATIAEQPAKRKILVVDDDPGWFGLLSLGLEGAGFSVITATSGPDALKRARSIPDLIVLDLVLPDLDGFTVCQTLKRDRDCLHPDCHADGLDQPA